MSAAHPIAESRREPRGKADCRATARIALSIELVDASASGVRARMSLPLPVGTTLKIGLPGGIERHARITWRDGEQVGCELLAALSGPELDKVLGATGIAAPRLAR